MMRCPFCQSENDASALVCNDCARDIAVPQSLIAEREDVMRKRDLLRDELVRAKAELEGLRRGKKGRSA